MVDIEENINRSNDIKDIMGKMPPYLIRRGAVLVTIVFIFLLFLLYIIKYPDVVRGNLVITTSNPPSRLVAKVDGKLLLLKKDKDQLKKDEIIAYIENSAEYNSILKLREQSTLFDSISNSPLLLLEKNINIPSAFQLGEIQSYYTAFYDECQKFKSFISLNENYSQIVQIQEKLQLARKKETLLLDKEKTALRKVQLQKQQFSKDSILFSKSVISQQDLDQSEKQYIDIVARYQDSKEATIANSNDIISFKMQIENLSINDKEKFRYFEIAIKSTYKELESQLHQFQEKYFVISPISGQLSLFNYWSNTQIVKKGDEIASVIPKEKQNEIIGKLQVQGLRFGKVKEKQKVKILLDNFPASEYGYIYGSVTSYSATNNNNTYLVNVVLPNGLTTSDSYKIQFNTEMHGMAEIITEDVSIMNRIFYRARRAFNKKIN